MLWLLRHGEAVDGGPDEARPLSDRGPRGGQAPEVALSRLGIKLDACLASPKLRTLQTARLACAPLGVEVTPEPALAGTEYDAERLAAGLGEVLLVAHNPAISATVRTLSGARVQMRPGGLAGIKRGELLVLMTADELSAIAMDAKVPV
jgi:phosphohistidine phosphatase